MPAHLDDPTNEDKEATNTSLQRQQEQLAKTQEKLDRIRKYIEEGVVTKEDICNNQEVDQAAKRASHHNLPPPEQF